MDERFQKFTVLVTTVGRCIHRIKTEEMAEFDLKSSHVSCLYYLYKSEPLTAKELCEICEEDKSNVSRAVRYLEEAGYLACHAKHQKRYSSPIVLTEKGREIGARIACKIDSIIERASEGLDEERRTVFYQTFARIMQNLQSICDEYDRTEGDGV